MYSSLFARVARTLVVVIAVAFSGLALAQGIETTGAPGSAGATTTPVA